MKLIFIILFFILYASLHADGQTTSWLIDPDLEELYPGHYEFHQKRILHIRKEDGKFYGQMTGFSELKLTPTGHHEFYFTDIDAKVVFQTNSSGQTTGLSFTREEIQQAQKINLASKPLKKKVLKHYEGKYKLNEQVEIRVFSKNGQLFAFHNDKELPLIPLRKHMFYSPSTVMKIGFNPDFDDSIISLTMYVGNAMEAQKI